MVGGVVMTSLGPDSGKVRMKQTPRVGSLVSGVEEGLERTFRGSRVGYGEAMLNQNLSMTFDPATLVCVVCTKPHSIIPTDGSGLVVLVTDQNFVSKLVGRYNCTPIIRLEDASLDELYSITSEVLDRTAIPSGTLFQVGSTSHLVQAGTTLYCMEWIRMCNRFGDRWRDIRVGPLPPIIREEVSGMVARQLIEMRFWFSKVYNTRIEYPKTAWGKLIDILNRTAEQGLDLGAEEVYTVAMPESMTDSTLVSQKFMVSSSHTVTACCEGEATDELLRDLLYLLHHSFGARSNPDDILDRSKKEQAVPRETETRVLKIVAMGASHCRRLASELRSRGHEIIDLSIPGWVANDVNIEKLKEEVGKLGSLDGWILLGDFLSNTTFRYVQEDDTLALPFKMDGRYHMAGKITSCGKDVVISTLKKVETLTALMHGLTFILPPLPRYLFSPCCDDNTHCVGVGMAGHAEDMVKKAHMVRRAMKDIYIKGGEVTAWVPDTVKGITSESVDVVGHLKRLTSGDGVHLTGVGYSKMADFLIPYIQSKLAASSNVAGTGEQREKQSTYYWRGFASPVGSARPKFAASRYRQTHGGGKWRGGPSWRGGGGGASGSGRGSGSGSGRGGRGSYRGRARN
jgi:uncharacterized membrane protein YgcG